MTTLRIQWQYLWLEALGRHLARELTPLMPAGREIFATGLTLSIVLRHEGERLQTAASMTLPTPDDEASVSVRTADHIFANLQDEIALHLGEAWPLSPHGRALHAIARPTGDGHAIGLFFEPGSGDAAETLVLEPFVPPPPLDEVRVAG